MKRKAMAVAGLLMILFSACTPREPEDEHVTLPYSMDEITPHYTETIFNDATFLFHFAFHYTEYPEQDLFLLSKGYSIDMVYWDLYALLDPEIRRHLLKFFPQDIVDLMLENKKQLNILVRYVIETSEDLPDSSLPSDSIQQLEQIHDSVLSGSTGTLCLENLFAYPKVMDRKFKDDEILKYLHELEQKLESAVAEWSRLESLSSGESE